MVSGTFERVGPGARGDGKPGRYSDLRLQEMGDEAASVTPGQSGPAPIGGELLEHSLETYVTRLGRTPILSAGQERLLGRYIEQGRYISRLRQELRGRSGRWPTAVEVLLAMAEHLAASDRLFEALSREVGLPSWDGIDRALLYPGLRSALDGCIDASLVEAVSSELGSSPEATRRDLIEFSLASGLVPWHSLSGLVGPGGLEQLQGWAESRELGNRLESSEAELSRHFEQVCDDGRRAFDHLVCSNVRLAIALAKRYANVDMPFVDLVQEGIVGLIRAATRFDHHRGHKFSTYATWWVRQSLGRAVAEQSRPFRLPRDAMGKIGTLHKAEERFSQEYGRAPRRDELAHEMGIAPYKVDELRHAASPTVVSLQSVMGDGEDETMLADIIEDKTMPSPVDQAGESLLRQQVHAVLQSLAPRERRVVQLRYGFTDGRSHTLAETGAELGVTKQRVQQLEIEALATLREHSGIGALRDYLS